MMKKENGVRGLYRVYTLSKINSTTNNRFLLNRDLTKESSSWLLPRNNLNEEYKVNSVPRERMLRKLSLVQEESLRPHAEFPSLSRMIVYRLRLWAARSRFNVGMKENEYFSNLAGNISIDTNEANYPETFNDFMVEHLIDSKEMTFLNNMGDFWFCISKASNILLDAIHQNYPVGGKHLPSNNSSNFRTFVSNFFENKLPTFFRKFSVFVTGALLLAVISLILYSVEVVIEDIEVWKLFIVASVSTLAYVPAELVEDSFFKLSSSISTMFSFFYHISFVIDALRFKMRLAFVGIFASNCIKNIFHIFSDDTSEALMDIFIINIALWALFEILLSLTIHFWEMRAYVDRINEILFKESLIRHLCKRNSSLFSQDTSSEWKEKWRTFSFRYLSQHSSFHRFKNCLNYVRDSDILVPLRRKHVHAPHDNFLSYEFSDHVWIKISKTSELDIVAEYIFNEIDHRRYGVITFAEWMEKFHSFRGAASTWSVIFGSVRNNIRGVDLVCFKEILRDFFLQRKDLGSTLCDFRDISDLLQKIVRSVFLVLMTIITLLAAGVSITMVITLISTILISGAVAFGNSIKAVFDSIIFVLYTKPYDVGDNIILRDPNDPMLTVAHISVMNTKFLGLDNKTLLIPNSVLLGMAIYNLRKTQKAQI